MTIKIFNPEQIFLIKCSQVLVTKHSTNVIQNNSNKLTKQMQQFYKFIT